MCSMVTCKLALWAVLVVTSWQHSCSHALNQGKEGCPCPYVGGCLQQCHGYAHSPTLSWNAFGVRVSDETISLNSTVMHQTLEALGQISRSTKDRTLQKIIHRDLLKRAHDHHIGRHHELAATSLRTPDSRSDEAHKKLVTSGPMCLGSQLESLGRNGFALIPNWGLDMTALEAEVTEALTLTALSQGAVITSDAKLRALEPLLHNESLNVLASLYLGEGAVLSGYRILSLTNELSSESEYISGHWHHDRCGRRLKAFIFLNDVRADGDRATLVARGSHNVMYYSYGVGESRFTDKCVRSEYEIIPMIGDRGGGFIFDTNIIHKAEVRGQKKRVAIILEFNHREKSRDLRTSAIHRMPCPSGGFRVVNKPCTVLDMGPCSLSNLIESHLEHLWLGLVFALGKRSGKAFHKECMLNLVSRVWRANVISLVNASRSASRPQLLWVCAPRHCGAGIVRDLIVPFQVHIARYIEVGNGPEVESASPDNFHYRLRDHPEATLRLRFLTFCETYPEAMAHRLRGPLITWKRRYRVEIVQEGLEQLFGSREMGNNASVLGGGSHLEVNQSFEVVFLSVGYAMDRIRIDETLHILRNSFMLHKTTKMTCEQYQLNFGCREMRGRTIVVHVGKPCYCDVLCLAARVSASEGCTKMQANLLPALNVYDPVDKVIRLGGLDRMIVRHPSLMRGFAAFIVTTRAMAKRVSLALRAVKLRAHTFLIPQAHSNFQHRHVTGKTVNRARGLRIGIVGGHDAMDMLRPRLRRFLLRQGLGSVRVVPVNGVCDRSAVKPPSKDGDCFASFLATLDVGVVWKKQYPWQFGLALHPALRSTLEREKPGQRLVNMLSVGLPTLAHASLHANRDVSYSASGVARLFPPLVKNVAELCMWLKRLLRSPRLRRRASRAALEVSRAYSPHSIGLLYLEAFSELLR